ncbi:MAG: hypothetical protein CVV44_11450 [Spirochaetae bacterium HGW-Spirochaetae-1]|jgi:vacuolar-type H+-ATPase subunit E/Vma4|nr:MAG: hypothetical protein CVV44_11450 [Spirochaetae bacterium HGW-Spirochaetae-1]
MNDERKAHETSQSDPAGILTSLKQEVNRKIEEIHRFTTEEMDKIKNDNEREMEEFRKKENDQTDGEIEFEKSKIINRTVIEKKKLRLSIIESFIETMIRDAAKKLRLNPEYPDFIFRHIDEAIEMTGSAMLLVKIGPADRDMIEKVKKYAGSKAGKCEVAVDESITMGGVEIFHEESGMLYNGSIDRIVYRHRDRLRRAVYTVLEEYGVLSPFGNN